MEETIALREAGYKTLRTFAAIRVKVLFCKRLTIRGYCGKASFHHKLKKIDITVMAFLMCVRIRFL